LTQKKKSTAFVSSGWTWVFALETYILGSIGFLFAGFFAGLFVQIPRPAFSTIAEITAFEPATAIQTTAVSAIPLSATVKNTGSVTGHFSVGFTIFGEDGRPVADLEKPAYLDPGQSDRVDFTVPTLSEGTYWIQYGVWSVVPARHLIVKRPSPSQPNVVVLKAPAKPQ
jgi:hypothetical protein